MKAKYLESKDTSGSQVAICASLFLKSSGYLGSIFLLDVNFRDNWGTITLVFTSRHFNSSVVLWPLIPHFSSNLCDT